MRTQMKEPVVYPAVKHKIPELFTLIITADALIEALRKLKVVNFEEFKIVRRERRDYTKAAENFIIRQKGGTTT